MKQYCRYCVYLCVNNVPYCDVKNKVLSESACKRPNNCKDFVFATEVTACHSQRLCHAPRHSLDKDVEDEYQDAFGETVIASQSLETLPRVKECVSDKTNGYHPRIRSPKKPRTDMIKDNQLVLPLS